MYTTRDKKPHPYDVVVGVVVQLFVTELLILYFCLFQAVCSVFTVIDITDFHKLPTVITKL